MDTFWRQAPDAVDPQTGSKNSLSCRCALLSSDIYHNTGVASNCTAVFAKAACSAKRVKAVCKDRTSRQLSVLESRGVSFFCWCTEKLFNLLQRKPAIWLQVGGKMRLKASTGYIDAVIFVLSSWTQNIHTSCYLPRIPPKQSGGLFLLIAILEEHTTRLDQIGDRCTA